MRQVILEVCLRSLFRATSSFANAPLRPKRHHHHGHQEAGNHAKYGRQVLLGVLPCRRLSPMYALARASDLVLHHSIESSHCKKRNNCEITGALELVVESGHEQLGSKVITAIIPIALDWRPSALLHPTPACSTQNARGHSRSRGDRSHRTTPELSPLHTRWLDIGVQGLHQTSHCGRSVFPHKSP